MVSLSRAAISSQTTTDQSGRIVHLGLSARYLCVAPALEGEARRLVRCMELGNKPPLEVRTDSRLSLGTTDPRTCQPVAGSATAWLLAADEQQLPCVLLGGLTGKGVRPSTTSAKLQDLPDFDGAYGLKLAVVLDAGCVPIDWRGLYLGGVTF